MRRWLVNPQVFTIFLGDAKSMLLRLDNDTCCTPGGPVDLTECSQIVVNLPNADGSYTALDLSSGVLDNSTRSARALSGRYLKRRVCASQHGRAAELQCDVHVSF